MTLVNGTDAAHGDRARGAMVGLALGDSVGMPALYHRQARLAERETLWDFSRHADAHGVNKYALPFSMYDNEILRLSGTDDSEQLALAARILLAAEGDHSRDALSAGWVREVVGVDADLRLAVSERASVSNLARGIGAPSSGSENPHSFDDSSVARAVAVGIRYAGRPDEAAAVAQRFAELTNSHDGVWAAQAMAVAIAHLVSGARLEQAIEAARELVPADSWLGRGMYRAMTIAAESGTAFEAVPALTEECSNTVYSYGNIAPETLPVAFAIALLSGADLPSAIGAASLIPKQADSMPAMVGALCGAASGLAAIPPSWVGRVERLKGHCVPSTAEESLIELADRLVEAARG